MIRWCRAVELPVRVTGEIVDYQEKPKGERVHMKHIKDLIDLYPGFITDKVRAKSWDKKSGDLTFTFELPIEKAKEFAKLDRSGEFIGKLDEDIDVRFSYFYNGKENTADHLWGDLKEGIDIER